jgi:predicted DNA-binding protein with PD1-like motif
MITAVSRRGRRIVGLLDRGSDLFESLGAVCRDHEIRSGELRGAGALESAELRAFDQARKRWTASRVLGGGLELLNLTGTISEQDGATAIVLRAALMRDRDSGVEVVGGHLLSAQVFAVEFVIEAFDDLILRRRAHVATGLDLWSDAITVAEPVPSGAEPERRVLPDDPAPTLDEPGPVRSAELDETAEVDGLPTHAMPAVTAAALVTPVVEELQLAVGDVIMHPQFRRCVVQRVEGEGEFVQVRLRSGRVVRLSLEVMELTPQGTQDGQRIFSAVMQ